MKIIDLDRIRESLPKRAIVTLNKTEKGTPFIRVVVSKPSLYENGTKEESDDIKMVRGWITDILGDENIMEIYAESTGTPWNIYLYRNAYDFINVSDEDINEFINMDLVKDGVVKGIPPSPVK